ncbi:MAG: sugar porter family MFS transporter [Labilithrix sp.]|nr:sugar porter family MFS transporter [Labilithrix sp.]MCW5817779.1 sugar porter family MFS transporter [Labilithrix sp.]
MADERGGGITRFAAAAALGGFLFGYDSAVVNGAVLGLERTFKTSSAGTGFAVASILLGCAVGALLAGRVADAKGRRPVMLVAAVTFAVTSFACGLAPSSGTFTFARFVSGLAVGAASVVCPAYIAEIAPARSRGRMGSLQQLGIVLGIFAALLADHLLALAAGGTNEKLWGGFEAWRWMFLVQIVPSFAFAVAVWFIPESPRYLVAAQEFTAALVVLQRIDPNATAEDVDAIRYTIDKDRQPRFSDLRDEEGKVHKIVWIGGALSVLQQLVGINSIFYYGDVLWESVGFSASDSLRNNVITGSINVGATVIAILTIDRFGRRPLLLVGSIGMAITLGVLAVAFAGAKSGPHGIVLSRDAAWAALVAANLYVFAFAVSWGPVVWVLLGEMFPNAFRGAAMAVAIFAQWMANWAVTISFPALVSGLGPVVPYGLYCGFSLVSFFVVRRFVRETKGRALEEASAEG